MPSNSPAAGRAPPWSSATPRASARAKEPSVSTCALPADYKAGSQGRGPVPRSLVRPSWSGVAVRDRSPRRAPRLCPSRRSVPPQFGAQSDSLAPDARRAGCARCRRRYHRAASRLAGGEGDGCGVKGTQMAKTKDQNRWRYSEHPPVLHAWAIITWVRRTSRTVPGSPTTVAASMIHAGMSERNETVVEDVTARVGETPAGIPVSAAREAYRVPLRGRTRRYHRVCAYGGMRDVLRQRVVRRSTTDSSSATHSYSTCRSHARGSSGSQSLPGRSADSCAAAPARRPLR